MSSEMKVRIVISLIAAGAFVWQIYSCRNREIVVHRENDDRRRYLAYGYTMMLPWIFGVSFVIGVLEVGWKQTLTYGMPTIFVTFFHICLYYGLLLICLPVLRKYISARVCAALWILPNGLYCIFGESMGLAKPLLVLPIPIWIVRYGLPVWGAGFGIVLLPKILSHLWFRHRILREAYPVTDQAMLAVWEKEQLEAGYTKAAGYKKLPYMLMISPAVITPLSIGFFQRTIRVVLPQRSYSSEELSLILRHEIVHIGREDSKNKFFLVLCTAMCWFNPLMWIANRRCSEDLELSCDETVLLHADESTRRQYAGLLLQTAGDDRGFTTCLSNRASALRYRLKHVMKPSKKWTGGILAGVVLFGLLISYGQMAFTYNGSTGREVIFQNMEPAEYSIEKISRYEDGAWQYYDCVDGEAWKAYLAELPVCEITGNYAFPERENAIRMRVCRRDRSWDVTLSDGVLRINTSEGDSFIEKKYYCPGDMDWEYIYSLIKPTE